MIRCIYSPFSDIYFHLAAEEYLLKQGNEDIFMLWQDTPSVVIGKHQRLRSEVDQEWAEREQVHIARRFSGGGTVYHDLGNVNLTFIETTPRLPDVGFPELYGTDGNRRRTIGDLSEWIENIRKCAMPVQGSGIVSLHAIV